MNLNTRDEIVPHLEQSHAGSNTHLNIWVCKGMKGTGRAESRSRWSGVHHQTAEQKLTLIKAACSSGRPASCLMAVKQPERWPAEHLDIIHIQYRKINVRASVPAERGSNTH